MAQTEYVLLVLGMMAVTYVPRATPLLLLPHVALPDRARRWLEFVPAAIMSALVVPALFAPAGQLAFGWHNPMLLAAVPTLLVALRTRSLGGSVIVGMAVYWLLTGQWAG